MHRRWGMSAALAALVLAALPIQRVHAGTGIDAGTTSINQVLLISIDGFHVLDYLNCVKGGYCPSLAALGSTGVNYLDTSTSKPSDSFPGLMALVTGGSPRTMGVNYDVAYDRALNPPQDRTGNGLNGGPCHGGTPIGTSTEYDEGINLNGGVLTGAANQMFLNGGAPSGEGGVNSIDATRHDGVKKRRVPNIFGMNFQAVSIGQKLIYQHGSVAAGYSQSGGYTDSIGTPSASLMKEIMFVDTSIGKMASELKKNGLAHSTLFIITAKHGQSPVDSSRYKANGSPDDPATIIASCLPIRN